MPFSPDYEKAAPRPKGDISCSVHRWEPSKNSIREPAFAALYFRRSEERGYIPNVRTNNYPKQRALPRAT
jgi:hypothetical protein